MKTLYLLRHAAAETGGTDDHERALTGGGALQARRAAQWLGEQGELPQSILSSSSARTLQTARILIDTLYRQVASKVDTRFDRKLYLAPADVLLAEIAAMPPNTGSLIVVGHNPGIAELAFNLSRGSFADFAQDFAAATMAAFACDIEDWHDLGPERAVLNSVFTAQD